MINIGERLAQLEKKVERLSRASRLSSASLDNTSLLVLDDNQSLRAIIGQQEDGTTAINITNGPPPPAPATPTVSSVLGGVSVTWNGSFAGNAVVPLDWQRCEVHASATGGFVPSQETLQVTIETPQGATVVLSATGPVYVCLLSRNTSGTASSPSAIVGPTGPSPVVATSVAPGAVDHQTITGATLRALYDDGSVAALMAPNLADPDYADGVPGFQAFDDPADGTGWVRMAVGEITFGRDSVDPYWRTGITGTGPTSTTTGEIQLSGGAMTGTTDSTAVLTLSQNSDGTPSIVASSVGSKVPLTMNVMGVLTAGNMAFGTVTITPSGAGAPTSAIVTGLSVKGTTFRAFVTANSAVPGSHVTGVSATNVTGTGLTIYGTRTDTTSFQVWWMVIGQ